jgi:hypothetical protein
MSTLFLTKLPKTYNGEKTAIFGKKWLSTCRKLKLDPSWSPCNSINSKWTKDLKIRPKTLQLVHKRAGDNLETIGIEKDFLSKTPAAQQLRENMDKWDYVKFKTF